VKQSVSCITFFVCVVANNVQDMLGYFYSAYLMKNK